MIRASDEGKGMKEKVSGTNGTVVSLVARNFDWNSVTIFAKHHTAEDGIE